MAKRQPDMAAAAWHQAAADAALQPREVGSEAPLKMTKDLWRPEESAFCSLLEDI